MRHLSNTKKLVMVCLLGGATLSLILGLAGLIAGHSWTDIGLSAVICFGLAFMIIILNVFRKGK
jgi:ABC-type dipeptide/oligopeptide/nickel transport system permease component